MRSEHPELKPTHDPDIEKYFDLRAAGRLANALAIYKSRIAPRYPNEAERTAVLQWYRRRDPRYAGAVARAWDQEAERLIAKLRRIIDYVALLVERFDRTDAYATIKAVETVLALLPRDRIAAVAAIERLRRHADLLEYRGAALAEAEDLVRDYLSDSLVVVEKERQRVRDAKEKAADERRRRLADEDRRAERESQEHRRALAKRRATPPATPAVAETRERKAFFDLSTLRFSAQDTARIVIPPKFSKLEDRALAFCFKYWPLATDGTFERTVFLYAKKYNSIHYDVFRLVKLARMGRLRDDELPSAVLSALSSGYYYSVGGDRYLQSGWRALKAKLEPSAREDDVSNSGDPSAHRRRRPSGGSRIRKSRMRDAETSTIRVGGTPPPKARGPVPEEVAEPAAEPGRRGSVADQLRRLSGRSYDIYRDLFFSKVRLSIRTHLVGSRQEGKHGFFAAVPEEVENLVYDFLNANYASPFMNWEASEERQKLRSSGYDLASLDGIIEDCYRRF